MAGQHPRVRLPVCSPAVWHCLRIGACRQVGQAVQGAGDSVGGGSVPRGSRYTRRPPALPAPCEGCGVPAARVLPARATAVMSPGLAVAGAAWQRVCNAQRGACSARRWVLVHAHPAAQGAAMRGGCLSIPPGPSPQRAVHASLLSSCPGAVAAVPSIFQEEQAVTWKSSTPPAPTPPCSSQALLSQNKTIFNK